MHNCFHRFDQSYSGPGQQNQKSAMIASTDEFKDPGWIADSGATNHCTPTSTNLQDNFDYEGSEQLYIGDGTGLDISVVGKSTFSSGSTNLYLKDILHIPRV